MFAFPKGTFNFFTDLLKMDFSVRTVFQSKRVLNIFNMLLSAMKTQITPNAVFYSVFKN